MLKRTQEILDYALEKIKEMQTVYPDGEAFRNAWNKDDAMKMCDMYASLACLSSTQFFTVIRPYGKKEDTLANLEYFFNAVKERALKIILEKEEEREEREEREKRKDKEKLH